MRSGEAGADENLKSDFASCATASLREKDFRSFHRAWIGLDPFCPAKRQSLSELPQAAFPGLRVAGYNVARERVLRRCPSGLSDFRAGAADRRKFSAFPALGEKFLRRVLRHGPSDRRFCGGRLRSQD